MRQNEVKRDSKLFYYSSAQWHFPFKTKYKNFQWQRKEDDSKTSNYQPLSFPVVWFMLGAFPSHLILLFSKQCLQLLWFCLLLKLQALGGAIYFFTDADILSIWFCHCCQLDPVLWFKKKRPGSFHTLRIDGSSGVKYQTIQSLIVNVFWEKLVF